MTDKEAISPAQQVIALFEAIQAGKHTNPDPWIEFTLDLKGNYELHRLLSEDKALFGYVKDKIRYDYDLEVGRFVIRRPTAVHEIFIDRLEDAIRSQLKAFQNGSGTASHFARKVQASRCTEMNIPVDGAPHDSQSKYHPDASFRHKNAQYPGVVVEVASSQNLNRLDRVAQNYLLDSDASVQVVVGFDIHDGYDMRKEATFSVWRTQIVGTTYGDKLQVFKEIDNQTFRDKHGNHTDYPGLRLHLSDFACEELTNGKIDTVGWRITVTTQELCDFLDAAEQKRHPIRTLIKHALPPGTKKIRQSTTPPEEVASTDHSICIE